MIILCKKYSMGLIGRFKVCMTYFNTNLKFDIFSFFSSVVVA